MATLAEIYEGATPEVTPAPVIEPTPEVVEPQGVKEPEPAQVEPPSPVIEERMVPLKALEEERRKRQEAEAKIPVQEQKTPDVFEDPEGYQKHMAETLQQATFNERCNISRFLAKRDFPDLEQKLETFQTLVTQYPQYAAQIRNSPSPYHEMAEIVAKHEKLKALENVDQVEAKLRAEIEAKVRAEIKAEAEKAEALKNSIPTSLVGMPSKGTIKGSTWSGPTPLKNIYK